MNVMRRLKSIASGRTSISSDPPLFPGESGIDQLVEIIKILGTPTREEIRCMNPNYTEFKFPQIKAHPWHKIFQKRMPPEAVDLVSRLLQYSPNLRCTAANSASGMHVNDECKVKFMELKAKRTYRYIVFKIDEKAQEVQIEKLGNPEETYDDFANSIPENECRYAIYDFDFTTEDNCQKSKIYFIAWSPDTSRVRSKMLYASSKDRFKREMDGIQVELQATDPSEMSLDIIKERALSRASGYDA
ncbi:hypothetical protein F2Q68_00018534, partial [Brassica cretica]